MENESSNLAQRSVPRWFVSLTSLGFIVLQSACTAIMAISGVRLIIGLGALAAALGLSGVAGGFHRDAVRIPMMVAAVLGSLLNFYVILKVRYLRNRPSGRWRFTPPSRQQTRSERIQIGMAITTLLLVFAEWVSHDRQNG